MILFIPQGHGLQNGIADRHSKSRDQLEISRTPGRLTIIRSQLPRRSRPVAWKILIQTIPVMPQNPLGSVRTQLRAPLPRMLISTRNLFPSPSLPARLSRNSTIQAAAVLRIRRSIILLHAVPSSVSRFYTIISLFFAFTIRMGTNGEVNGLMPAVLGAACSPASERIRCSGREQNRVYIFYLHTPRNSSHDYQELF